MSGPPLTPRRVAVLGAGTMGRGIAQAAAQAGCAVSLRDVSDDMLERARAAIRATLDGGVARQKLTEEARDAALASIMTTTDVASAVHDAELVIEAVPEDLGLKRAVIAEVEASAPSTAIVASNTSSLSIGALAAGARRPERVVGMHFFNPVHVMKLVEIVASSSTGAHAVGTARALAEAMGKTAIVVRDTPGFATSRLGVILGLEAIRMLEQGVATAADIDRAMEMGYNHPMGPLRLTDLVGLDVRLAIADYLHTTLGGDQYRAPDLLRRLVGEGKLGKKSGEGFFRWDR
jgi:3-hydroxybutyryl-CoA dehydrogenase